MWDTGNPVRKLDRFSLHFVDLPPPHNQQRCKLNKRVNSNLCGPLSIYPPRYRLDMIGLCFRQTRADWGHQGYDIRGWVVQQILHHQAQRSKAELLTLTTCLTFVPLSMPTQPTKSRPRLVSAIPFCGPCALWSIKDILSTFGGIQIRCPRLRGEEGHGKADVVREAAWI